MKIFQRTGVFHAIITAAVFMLCQIPGPVAADDTPVNRETLLDRVQIEDLMNHFYSDLGWASGQEMAREYFTEDAILDINGMVFQGHDEIMGVYKRETAGDRGTPGITHTLITDPIVNVNGDKATIWLVWTHVKNDNIRMAPRMGEQGRDYTELEQHNGRWYIKHRQVNTDGGIPDAWDDNYVHKTFR